MSKFRRQLMMASLVEPVPPPPPLPYDAEVEYLESTGTQWIDTGIVPTLNKTIRCRFEVLYRNVQARQIMGRQGSVYFGAVNGKLQVSTGGTTTTNVTLSSDTWSVGDVSFPIPNAANNNMTATYTWGESTGTSTNKYTNTPSNGAFWLFCCNNADTLRGSNALKYFKLWQDEELIRDFIPVRVGQVGYMYDRVSGELFGNSGTGNFILGNDKN